nr:reverse transcriptase domain-containing protein [Tanacetum cinerariifolium]
MVINSPCLTDKKELASLEKMLTSKDFSNPLMDGSFPKPTNAKSVGTACLLNEAIFEDLARMGAKTTAWNEFSSTMASAIIYLADNQKFNFSKYIFDNMVKSLKGRVKFYLFPRFLQVFLDKEVKGMARHKEQYIISSHTKNIFTNIRRIGAGFSGVTTSLFDYMMVQATANIGGNRGRRQRFLMISQRIRTMSLHLSMIHYLVEDESKQGRMIEEIDQNADIALDDETQGRTNDDEMFGVDDLNGEEVVIETTTGVKDSATPTTDVIEDEVIMAQALDALKSTKPNVVQSQIPTASSSKDKGKAKMIKPEVPIKKKEQMKIDEELLAKKLQARESKEFFEVEKARLLVELIEKRKKHLAALRAQEKRTMDSKAQESSTKRIAKHLESNISKKQKVDENVKPVVDDSEELRKCIEIVPDDGDETTILIKKLKDLEDEYQVYGMIVRIKTLQGVTAIQETFMDLKTQLETIGKNHQASIQNLETKFDRLADKQSGRPSRFLPSNTQPNLKGYNSKAYQPLQARNQHVNAIFTRSDKSYNPPVNPNDEQENSEIPINFDSDDEDDGTTPQPKTQNPKPAKETSLPKASKERENGSPI